MVGGNSVNDILAFTVFFGDIRTYDSVGAFHLMVYGLAYVMQQSGALGPLDVHAQFGGHHTAQRRHLERMLKHVLGKAGAVF